MDMKKLLELQTHRGAKAFGGETVKKTLEAVISECRKEIHENSDKYRDLETLEKKKVIQDIIVSYVMNRKPLVDGYIDSNNSPQLIKLMDKLVEEITDYGILTGAILDDDVFEIRCNGRELKIEKGGRVIDLTDKEGNIVSFTSPEQQDIVIRKLLGDVRLTPKDSNVNARTIEGYRVAAIHSSALSPDPNDPMGTAYHGFVLRKFKKIKMGLDQIVKKGTMSDNMAKLCELAMAGGLTTVVCGVTASGKTTTINAILQSIPNSTRTILIQNPSEIDIRKRDASGRVINDVLHLEAKETDSVSTTIASFENHMASSLRLSPTIVVLGEIRRNTEFDLGMMIMKSGHPIVCSYHAGSSEEALQRYLTAYMASSNERIETALPNLTSVIKLIVIQKVLKDGTRRVLEMTEVLGVDPANQNRAKLNTIYKFIPTGEPEFDSDGSVLKIPGEHKRVGKLSEELLSKLRVEATKSSIYKEFMRDIDVNEVETYTGKW